jgi:hypothetical protein
MTTREERGIAPVPISVWMIAAAAILVGGCGGGPSEELRALKADPIARYTPTGVT